MQTRIILHGGNSDRNTDKNEKFFKEIVGGVDGGTVRVLCVYYARPPHRWDDSYAVDQSAFKRVQQEMGVEIQTKLATYDFDAFTEDAKWSDVIFINGGVKGHLKELLLFIGLERFRRIVEGKTLVGISAGANVLARYYFSTVAGGIREGTGFLNVKVLTHYSEDKPEQLEQLKAYGEELPIITIPEEEYVVVR